MTTRRNLELSVCPSASGMFGSLTRGLNADTPSSPGRKRGHRPEVIGRLFTESPSETTRQTPVSEASVRGQRQRPVSEATRQKPASEASVRDQCQRPVSETSFRGQCQRSPVKNQRQKPASAATARGHRRRSSSPTGWAGAEADAARLVCHFLSVSTPSSEPLPVKVRGAESYSANERADI